MNNYNWMPLSEALETMPHSTLVCWRKSHWANDGMLVSALAALLGFKDTKTKIIVCRVLVPEVPSFEDEK